MSTIVITAIVAAAGTASVFSMAFFLGSPSAFESWLNARDKQRQRDLELERERLRMLGP